MDEHKRNAKVERFRQMYLDGTLDRVLFDRGAKVDRLMDALYPSQGKLCLKEGASR